MIGHWKVKEREGKIVIRIKEKRVKRADLSRFKKIDLREEKNIRWIINEKRNDSLKK